MPKDIYKITSFQSGINNSGDSKDIDDTYSVEMTGLSSSNAGKLKVHGGLDYYSVTTEYTDVSNEEGDDFNVILPKFSHWTYSSASFIEYDGKNALGGGALFYFTEDYDLSKLSPFNWGSLGDSYASKGVEYFLNSNNGYLQLLYIRHNDDGTQVGGSLPWYLNENNIIYDGMHGIYHHRNKVGGTVDGIDYSKDSVVGCWAGAVDGRYEDSDTEGKFFAGDTNKPSSPVKFFQQGGLIRYVNSEPTTLSRYGHGHTHYIGMIKHDGIINSIYGSTDSTDTAFGSVRIEGYQILQMGGTTWMSNWSTNENVPDKQFYQAPFHTFDSDGNPSIGSGSMIKRNNFFVGEAAPILRPRVYSYGTGAGDNIGASTTFHVNIGKEGHNHLPIGDGSNGTTTHGTEGVPAVDVDNNDYHMMTHIDDWDNLKDYPTRSKSTLSLWQGATTGSDSIDYETGAPDLIGEWEFGMTAIYLDGQETNIVLGTRLVDYGNDEAFFEKVRIKTDDWNGDGSTDPSGTMRFAIHLLGWPFLDSERISKYRYYMRDVGTQAWYNFAEVDLASAMLNTFACKSLVSDYQSSQKLTPFVSAQGITTYRSAIWEITGLPEFEYSDHNGHNSSGSWVSTDVNYHTSSNLVQPTDDEYNGIGLQEENIKFWGLWKTAALYKNRVFYGNITTSDGVEREDTMIHSPEYQYDKMPFDGFHWVNIATGDGDKIIHLDSYGGHLLQFKRKNVYALKYDDNQDIVVDKTFTGLGIAHPCQVCHTPNGLVWITAQGCFLFRNGNIENLIDNKIATGNQYIPIPSDASLEFSLSNTTNWYGSNPWNGPGDNGNSWWTLDGSDPTSGKWDANAIDYINHGWKGFFLPSVDIGIENSRPFIGYDALEDMLIIGRSANFQTDWMNIKKGAASRRTHFGGKNDAYIYNFKTASWNFMKHAFTSYKNPDKELVNTKWLTSHNGFVDGQSFTYGSSRARLAHVKSNPILTRDGRFAIGLAQLSHVDGSGDNDGVEFDSPWCNQHHMNIMAWDSNPYKASPFARGMGCLITKDVDFGLPAVRKKVYKVYITYRYPNISDLWNDNGEPENKVVVSYFVNGNRTFPNGDDEIANENKVGYFGQNFYYGALEMVGDENADASGILTGADNNDWRTAILQPSDSVDADNIYSFQLMISASQNGRGLKPGGTCEGFPPGFEIADISIVYRRKQIK